MEVSGLRGRVSDLVSRRNRGRKAGFPLRRLRRRPLYAALAVTTLLILVLIAAAVISAVIGDIKDVLIILAIGCLP